VSSPQPPYSPPYQQDLHPFRPHNSRQHRGRRGVCRREKRRLHWPLDRNLRLDLSVPDSRALCSGRVVGAEEARFLLIRIRRGGRPGAQRAVC
jgi:hypothetical protein